MKTTHNKKERQELMQMFIASIGQIGGFFGVNIYDFLVRIMGSEILRTIISFLIRQSLTHIGL